MGVRRKFIASSQPLYTFPKLSSSSWQEQLPVMMRPIGRYRTRLLRCHLWDSLQHSRRDQRELFSLKRFLV